MELRLRNLLKVVAFTFLTSNLAANNGLAPEVTDLNAEDISFQKEKEIKPDQLAKGANKITLDQAMQMRSGIRLPKKKIGEIIQRPSLLLAGPGVDPKSHPRKVKGFLRSENQPPNPQFLKNWGDSVESGRNATASSFPVCGSTGTRQK